MSPTVKTIGMLLLVIVVGLGVIAAFEWQQAEKAAVQKRAPAVAQKESGAVGRLEDYTQESIRTILGAPQAAENRGGDVSWQYGDAMVLFGPDGHVRGSVSTRPGRELDTFVITRDENGKYQLVSQLPIGGYKESREANGWNRTPAPTAKRWGSSLDRKAYR